MEGLLGFVMMGAGIILTAQVAALVMHHKERRRKLEMMKEYPHLSKEIWQSIEEQDARFEQSNRDFADAFKRKPKPKPGRGILKLGLGIARRFVK
jgi:hypothetical protein